jgi:polyhydroxyalkanoate synthesis regulator phasin
LVKSLYTVVYGKGVRKLAGLFNNNDQFDFKFNVNGKEVSGEEGAKYAQELVGKLSTEMGGLVQKLTKGLTNNVSESTMEAVKEKVAPNVDLDSIKEKVANIDFDSLKDKVMPNLNPETLKSLVNQETLSKLQEKLPVIDASNDDGNLKLNVNGKPIFSLDLSDFIKK